MNPLLYRLSYAAGEVRVLPGQKAVRKDQHKALTDMEMRRSAAIVTIRLDAS